MRCAGVVTCLVLSIFVPIAVLWGNQPKAGSQTCSECGLELVDADLARVGGGDEDATEVIQRIVDRGGDIRLPSGTYRITRPIVVDLAKTGFVSITGGSAVRLIMAGPGPALKLIGTHRGTADPSTVKPEVWQQQRMPLIDTLEIVGAHPQAGGVEAVGTMQLTISRLTVRSALHGIHLPNHNRNVIVSDCHLYNNRGVGLYLDSINLHQINVIGCHISYNVGGGIVVRDSSVCNLQINGCDIEANMAPDRPATANVLIDTAGGPNASAEFAIVGCTIQHRHGCPDSANVRFNGTNLEDRISEDRVWGNLVIGDNVMSDAEINIDIRNGRGVSIVGNTLWRGYQYNLRIEESSNVAIGPNVLDRNPRYYWGGEHARNGVLLRNCDAITVTGLHLNDVRHPEAGLIIDNCRRVNLDGCTILNCDHGGLLLRDSVGCRVSDCLIANDKSRSEVWRSLVVSGGCENMVVDNLLGVSEDIDPAAAHANGNIVQP